MTNSAQAGRPRLRARLVILGISTALASGFVTPAMAQSPHPDPEATGVDLDYGVIQSGICQLL